MYTNYHSSNLKMKNRILIKSSKNKDYIKIMYTENIGKDTCCNQNKESKHKLLIYICMRACVYIKRKKTSSQ